MAQPKNPLDKYVTYACHFELHAAKTNDELSSQNGSASEKVTSRFSANGTLLINTRKDAHQTIDNVKIECFSPGTTKTDVADGLGMINLDVLEPGSFAFIEKLKEKKDELSITNMENMVFGLKVVFVGRTADNTVDVIAQPIIPMVLLDMTGSFTQQGGTYHMMFIASQTLATTRAGSKGPQMNFGYTNRKITFEASTVEEALGKLQGKLNEIYQFEVSKDIDKGPQRGITYKITWDPEVSGKLVGGQASSFSPDEPRKLEYDFKKPISSIIMDTLARCPTLNDQIGAAKSSMRQPFNAGAFHPVIIPSVKYNAGDAEVTYHVKIYKGGGPKFEFDYYFTDAGKNVDVLGYDVKFNNISAWLSTMNTRSQDKHTNQSGQVTDPKEAINWLHPNVEQAKIVEQVAKSTPEGKAGDFCHLASRPFKSVTGYNTHPYNKVTSVKAATDSMLHFAAAINFAPNFEIRGHKTLLDLCISDPGSTAGLTAGADGVWIKVNIYMPEGDGKRKFFYEDYYRVLTITNLFSNGKFTQQITMLANVS